MLHTHTSSLSCPSTQISGSGYTEYSQGAKVLPYHQTGSKPTRYLCRWQEFFVLTKLETDIRMTLLPRLKNRVGTHFPVKFHEFSRTFLGVSGSLAKTT